MHFGKGFLPHMQLLTGLNYSFKHLQIYSCSLALGVSTSITTHSNFLLHAYTPNGAISYISDLFVGSISDVELTKTSGFLKVLEDKPGVSIMADRGFTIKDVLKELNIDLNMPPFLEGQRQLSAERFRKEGL